MEADFRLVAFSQLVSNARHKFASSNRQKAFQSQEKRRCEYFGAALEILKYNAFKHGTLLACD
jgi:hypothetical protein